MQFELTPLTVGRTLLVSPSGLDNAKRLVSLYKQSHVPLMTPELWQAKKVVDSTLHPGPSTSSIYLSLD